MTLKTNIICGNVDTFNFGLDMDSVDLVVTKPPNFQNSAMNYEEYSKSVFKAFVSCYNVLKDGHYIAIIVPPMLDAMGMRENVGAWLSIEAEGAGFHFVDHITVISGGVARPRSAEFKKSKGQPRTYKANVVSTDVYLYCKGSASRKRYDKEWTKFIYKNRVSKGINTLDNYIDIGASEHRAGVEYYHDWLLTNVWRFGGSLTRLLIQLFSYEGEVVFDPFATEGDTMKQAQLLNRNASGLVPGQSGLKLLQRTLGYGMPSLLPEDEPREFETTELE